MLLDTTGNSWFKETRRACSFVRPHYGSVSVVIGLTLGMAAIEAFEPLILKYFFDELAQGVSQALLIGVGGLLTIGILREALGGLSNWLVWKIRLKLNYALMDAIVGRLHSLPLRYHSRESVGSIMTKLDRGINGFVGALSDIAFGVFPGLLYLSLSLVVMFRLDWRLSMVVVFFGPLPALIGMWAAREQTEREKIVMGRWVQVFSHLNEVLAGIMTVKSFVMEEKEKLRFLKGVDHANELVIRGVATDTKVGAAKNSVTMLARIGAIGMGGYLVFEGEITPGTLIAFLGYIGGLFGPVQGLTGMYQTVRKATVSRDVIFSILDADDDLEDRPHSRPVEVVRGEVIFEDVVFEYEKGIPVLNGISLHVRPGETVALVGPSGAGKTTMMALLQRLYDPVSGCVRVDGTDIRDFRQRSLRLKIGVVVQDGSLFNDTVLNNIAYGGPKASKQEVEKAAKAANAHDFIMRMPGGYETVIGERGNRLSAGEKQRLSIARALLKDPPILIFDEATSALDAESEELVQKALFRLIENRTVFIIAHRLATITRADRILVLKGGRIIETGTHEKLMSLDGYYASVVMKQTRGLINSEAA